MRGREQDAAEEGAGPCQGAASRSDRRRRRPGSQAGGRRRVVRRAVCIIHLHANTLPARAGLWRAAAGASKAQCIFMCVRHAHRERTSPAA